MAITLYVAGSNCSYASQDIGTKLTTGAGPAANAYLWAIGDSEQKLKFFYSSYNGGSSPQVALPQIVAPNVVPQSSTQYVWTGIGSTAGPIYQLQGYEVPEFGQTSSTTAPGPLLVCVNFGAGSPDAGSPGQYYLDAGAILIVSDLAYQGA